MNAKQLIHLLLVPCFLCALSPSTRAAIALANAEQSHLIMVNPIQKQLSYTFSEDLENFPNALMMNNYTALHRYDSLLHNIGASIDLNANYPSEQELFLPTVPTESFRDQYTMTRSLITPRIIGAFRISDEPLVPHVGLIATPIRITDRRTAIDSTRELFVEKEPIELFVGFQIADNEDLSLSISFPRLAINAGDLLSGGISATMPTELKIGGSINGQLLILDQGKWQLNLITAVERRALPRMHFSIHDGQGNITTSHIVTTHQTDAQLYLHAIRDPFFATLGYHGALNEFFHDQFTEELLPDFCPLPSSGADTMQHALIAAAGARIFNNLLINFGAEVGTKATNPYAKLNASIGLMF